MSKIYKLTPNVNSKVSYNYSKRTTFKVLNETKKIHLQKKDFTRENLIEFSILFIMVFYGGAIHTNIQNISKITFSNSDNEKLKNFLIEEIKLDKTEKEIENGALKAYPDLVRNIIANSKFENDS